MSHATSKTFVPARKSNTYERLIAFVLVLIILVAALQVTFPRGNAAPVLDTEPMVQDNPCYKWQDVSPYSVIGDRRIRQAHCEPVGEVSKVEVKVQISEPRESIKQVVVVVTPTPTKDSPETTVVIVPPTINTPVPPVVVVTPEPTQVPPVVVVTEPPVVVTPEPSQPGNPGNDNPVGNAGEKCEKGMCENGDGTGERGKSQKDG